MSITPHHNPATLHLDLLVTPAEITPVVGAMISVRLAPGVRLASRDAATFAMLADACQRAAAFVEAADREADQ